MQKRHYLLLAIGWLALLLNTATLAQSQQANLQPGSKQSGSNGSENKVHGYGFAGPAFSRYGDTGLNAGFGVEGLVYKGLGVGAELAYLGSGFDSGIGAFSANGSYHFKNSSKVTPFVTGGYTLFFRSGVANGVNGGGGINYWFKERMAFRAEFRAQSFAADSDATIYSLRFGLTFR